MTELISKYDQILEKLDGIHKDINVICNYQNEILMNFFFENPDYLTTANTYLNDQKPAINRSSETTTTMRAEGNQVFKENPGSFLSVLVYSGAIMSAPCGSVELALAHANRAAALKRLKFYDEALLDCNLALEYKHPDPYKLIERKCLCSSLLKSKDKMTESLNQLKEIVGLNGSEAKIAVLQKYQTVLDQMDEPIVEILKDMKLNIADNHVYVKQEHSEKAGRYVLSTKKLVVDEKIISERCFAFVPVSEPFGRRLINVDCENCASTNVIPFFCTTCGRASYCSPSCLKDHQFIHKYECEGYKLNLWHQIGIAHLSLRCLLTGIGALVQKVKDMRALEKSDQFEVPEKLLCKVLEVCRKDYNNYFDDKKDEFTGYARVLGLVPNLFQDGKFPMKNFQYGFTAFILTNYLKSRTSFFEDYMDKTIMVDQSDWELFISALLLRHLGQLVANGHAIVDFRQQIFTVVDSNLLDEKKIVSFSKMHHFYKSQRIFTAIFPKISMLNHSCCQNIRNVFEKTNLTVCSTQSLPAGSELLNCYGPHYKLMPYRERQDALLKQYNFTCECTKCLEKSNDNKLYDCSLCMKCKKELFLPDFDFEKPEDEQDNTLTCSDCKIVHFNPATKKFFDIFDQPGALLYDIHETFEQGVEFLGPLSSMRMQMIKMMLTTFLDNQIAFNPNNIKYPVMLSLELLNAQEKIYGVLSVEYVENSFFFLDILAILKKKQFENAVKFDWGGMLRKVQKSFDILSENAKDILNIYTKKYID